MVDGQSTDRLRVGNFNEQVWGDLRERDQGCGLAVTNGHLPTRLWRQGPGQRLVAGSSPPTRWQRGMRLIDCPGESRMRENFMSG